jgi:hypothetical protein
MPRTQRTLVFTTAIGWLVIVGARDDAHALKLPTWNIGASQQYRQRGLLGRARRQITKRLGAMPCCFKSTIRPASADVEPETRDDADADADAEAGTGLRVNSRQKTPCLDNPLILA